MEADSSPLGGQCIGGRSVRNATAGRFPPPGRAGRRSSPRPGAPPRSNSPRRSPAPAPGAALLLGVAFVIAFLVKTFVAQAFFIPSESMVHTLEVGDRVLVSRVSYQLHEPRRGDIVVFTSPFETAGARATAGRCRPGSCTPSWRASGSASRRRRTSSSG